MDIFGIMKEQFTRGQDLAVNGYYSPGLRLHFFSYTAAVCTQNRCSSQRLKGTWENQ